MNFPKKIIAKPGRIALIVIGRRHIEVNQFNPVSLENYTNKELRTSNIMEMLEGGAIEEYTSQSIIERPESKIPNIKAGVPSENATRVTFTQENVGLHAIKTNPIIPENLPKELQERVARVEKLKKEEDAAQRKRMAPKSQPSKPAVNIKVRVDGKETNQITPKK
jgi:hypothetical protein